MKTLFLNEKKFFIGFFFFVSIFPPLISILPVSAYEATLTTQEVEGALENTKLNEVLGQYLATVQMYDPERATRMGIHGTDSVLTQRTQERVNKQLEAFKNLRSKLHDIKTASMYPSLQVDYVVLDHLLEVDIYEMENLGLLKMRPQYYLEPLFSAYHLLSKDFGDYNIRAGNAMVRLREFPQILEQAERNLFHPPRIWAEQALKLTDSALNGVSDFIPLFRGYTRYDPVLKTQVDEIMDKVKTALTRYRDFLKNEIIPNSDGEFRAGSYIYGFYLERWHGLSITPGSALSYSKKSCKTALKDLAKEAVNIDALLAKEKGWKGVMAKLPKEHPPLSDVLKVFQDEVDRAYQHFDEYKVVEFPKQRLLIRKMPDFMSAALPYVYYAEPFALDDVRVSELYLALPSDKLPAPTQERILSSGFNYAQIELLVAFDIMPGMHLRSYTADSNSSRIRKIANQPMVTNGWACYAELMAGEMGYYSSYWAKFLRVYVRALRAGRAYVDTALHTNKMTYEEAVGFFQETFYMSKGQAQTEVLRISLSPTESLSYIMGMDRILEMRGYYMRTEDKYFDLRKFHSSFLRQGKIPLRDIDAELKRLKKESLNVPK
ncbi:MAG: hypothetical protein A2270_01550 [Elusimicrobia bacterium RIFOXYA12_FULL_51_18]|nr:MAG: hypothetical protein A2270_01550 [Elusimicrobia bacterium RIFOXYA12_FULL_51_18]OGS29611.1 MAG: hypothetical protein A2218_01245 [Elusimicrobia bacterium RIFOXYA2_FULL_53_38]